MKFIEEVIRREDIQIRPGASAIVSNENDEILLEKRRDCSLWGIPGGRIEPGESITESCKREFLEETGLEIEITGVVGVYTGPEEGFPLREYPDALVQVIDIVLKGERISGVLEVSAESHELSYFSRSNLPPMVPNTETILQNYYDNTVGVI
jgi:ADP-ribose pyrophosphatase YjhB (NUDIX family)